MDGWMNGEIYWIFGDLPNFNVNCIANRNLQIKLKLIRQKKNKKSTFNLVATSAKTKQSKQNN